MNRQAAKNEDYSGRVSALHVKHADAEGRLGRLGRLYAAITRRSSLSMGTERPFAGGLPLLGARGAGVVAIPSRLTGAERHVA